MKYEFTVRENIGFGRIDDIEEEERLISAARQAGIEKRINQMEDTYDAQLGRFLKRDMNCLADNGKSLRWREPSLEKVILLF